MASISHFPPDLVASITRGALQDADRVCQFLDALGFKPTTGRPVRLPANFLSGLGAALRLLHWEQSGLRAHLDCGSPTAKEVLYETFRAAVDGSGDQNPTVSTLAFRVMVLSIEKLAWTAQSDLGGDVALGVADEESIMEALADFLWAHRPG